MGRNAPHVHLQHEDEEKRKDKGRDRMEEAHKRTTRRCEPHVSDSAKGLLEQSVAGHHGVRLAKPFKALKERASRGRGSKHGVVRGVFGVATKPKVVCRKCLS